MTVTFIPKNFFGLSGAGQALQDIGTQRREDRATRRLEERENIADDLAIEGAAIDRYKLLTQMGIDMPGDQGFALRRQAAEGLRSVGLVELDSRLELSAADINANADRLALATAASERTDEQWQRVGGLMGLQPGITPQQVRIGIENNLTKQGFDITALQESETTREEYKDYLRTNRNMTPGQIDAEVAYAGLLDLRQGIDLKESNAALADANVRLVDARIEALGAEGSSEIAKARIGLLKPFFDQMAEHGVDARVAFQMANGQELSPDNEKTVTTALTSIARAASTVPEKVQLLADLLKIENLGESIHALSLAGIAAEVFGPDVVTATERKRFGRSPRWEIDINTALAVSRLSAGEGEDPAERQQGVEEAMTRMQAMVTSITDIDDLSSAIADAEQRDETTFILKPILIDMLQKRMGELESSGGASTAELETEEEGDLSEEEHLREELRKATEARDIEEITRIRAALLEFETGEGSDERRELSTAITALRRRIRTEKKVGVEDVSGLEAELETLLARSREIRRRLAADSVGRRSR